MKESIYRRTMFGEIERGESLDMTDDSFGHVAGVEQEFVDQRHGQGFHVLAHFGQQHQTPFEQGRGALFAEIALVAEELAGEVSGELLHRRAIVDIAGGELDRHDCIAVIEYQMELEAEAPAHRGFTACGQASEGFISADAAVMAHRQRGRVNVIDASSLSQATEQKTQPQGQHVWLERHKPLITRHLWNIAAQYLSDYPI